MDKLFQDCAAWHLPDVYAVHIVLAVVLMVLVLVLVLLVVHSSRHLTSLDLLRLLPHSWLVLD